MTDASASGAAYDVTGMVVETDKHAALRAELAELTERLTDAERAREARRVEIGHQLYERDAQTPGTPARAAHVAQLRRLHDEAATALDGAQRALDKAREHVAGKEDALGDAQEAYAKAEAALAEVDTDGSAE